MIRQYNPQRHRNVTIRGRLRAIGTIPTGTILRVRGRKLRVEAWIPREYTAVQNGRFVTRRIAGGHMALVRDLATNRLGHLSDAHLVDAEQIELDRPTICGVTAEEERAAAADAEVQRNRTYFQEGV